MIEKQPNTISLSAPGQTEMEEKRVELEKALVQFCGTQKYYAGWCGVNYTDGVFYLTQNGMSWLVTDICSYQVEKKYRRIPFQLWKLRVNEDKTATLTLQEDSNEPVMVRQEYNWTDCPLKEISLYLINNVLLLPSEY